MNNEDVLLQILVLIAGVLTILAAGCLIFTYIVLLHWRDYVRHLRTIEPKRDANGRLFRERL